MDPKHRDRIAFMRICSGHFKRGMTLFQTRTGKGLKVKDWMKPLFMFFVPICILGLYIIGLSKFF